MNQTAGILLGCLGVMLLTAACQNRFQGWPAFPHFVLYPNGVPFSLTGPPPTIFTFQGVQTPDLSGINQDYFFPANPERVLVADDAYQAGLFDPNNHRFKPTRRRHLPSTGGTHVLEIHAGRVEGHPRHILRVTDRHATILQNQWSPGTFAGVFWSPDGKRYGFNERHPAKGDAHTLKIFELETGEELLLELRLDSLHGFFRPDQINQSTSYSMRHWLSPEQCVIWVHGPFDGPLLDPQWGYEALVDLSVSSPAPNARMLRAFVRREVAKPSAQQDP
jgi:hypothetical protein